ncbi:AraC family transcriptional regulator [Arthrobacter sp. E3]|uniref:helix-turn-helix domain-containing protein n=1 Tax=Arthrobacter sp. E3 TaxID=517402 RepID=UPI001A94A0C9|nr:AraC family transcriptional regulator [Arthrobacter sp. E3]
MKADTGSQHRDPIMRAHLRDPRDVSHTIYRYPPGAELLPLIGRYWFPVWSVPAGAEEVQRVLQYPVCLLAITTAYSRFYGVVSGVSATTLSGEGWAAGVMLIPAAGHAITGLPVDGFTDRHVDLADVLGTVGTELTARIRTLMNERPAAKESHKAVMAAYEDVLCSFLPIDDEGRLVQRRRLHEAAERLRDSLATVAELAFLLGYADQAHFIRDFKKVVSLTPGQFSEQNRG